MTLKRSNRAPELWDIFGLLSDEKSLRMFRFIASGEGRIESMQAKLRLTRKQYYSRLSQMVDAGMVKRKMRRYELTAMGKILAEEVRVFGEVLEKFTELRVLEIINETDIPMPEREKLWKSLLSSGLLERIKNGETQKSDTDEDQ